MENQRIEDLVQCLRTKGIDNEFLLNVISNVPRELFVDEIFKDQAWEDIALPIGDGQTISQPYIVARMTMLLELNSYYRVLEIGTGSGYQTAILSYFVDRVYSIERIERLQWNALSRLKRLGLSNIITKHGDGFQGWSSCGPFNAIILTSAPTDIPTSLMLQLDTGGVMLLPVGSEYQFLKRLRRKESGFVEEIFEPVSFVPMLHGLVYSE